MAAEALNSWANDIMFKTFTESVFELSNLFINMSALLFVLSAAIVFIFTRNLGKKKKPVSCPAPPAVNTGLPIIGNVLSFLRDPLELPTHAFRTVGKVFTIKVGHENMTYLIGPDAVHAMYTAKDGDLGTVKALYSTLQLVFGMRMATEASKLEFRRRIRRVMVPLSATNFERYVHIVVKECREVFATMPDEGHVDMLELFGKITIPVHAACIFNENFRDSLAPFDHTFHNYLAVTRGLTPLSFFSCRFPTKAHRARDRAKHELYKKVAKFVQTRPKAVDGEEDIIEDLLKETLPDGQRYPMSEYVGTIVSIMFTVNTLFSNSTWLGMRLLLNENIHRRVREEQDKVLAESNGKLTAEAIEKMDLLHASLKESLRMNTTDQFALRRVLKPLVVCDGRYEIPSGDMILVSPKLSGLDESVFSDPDRYDPDRFLAPREEGKNKQFSYVNFGAAYHKCPGERYGFLVIKTIWSTVLKEFDLELVDKTFPDPVNSSFFHTPQSGKCIVKYKRKKPIRP